MKLIKKNNKKGFTLVELIVVIAILAILALILVPAITKYVDGANKSKDQANARAIYSEAMLMIANNEVIGTGDEQIKSELTDKFNEQYSKIGTVEIVVEKGQVKSVKVGDQIYPSDK